MGCQKLMKNFIYDLTSKIKEILLTLRFYETNI